MIIPIKNCVLILIWLEIVVAKINVSIQCGKNASDVTIKHSGIDVKIVEDAERRQFGIRSSELREAVKKHLGKNPTNIYLKGPTPWGDLYKLYRWEDVKRILKVKTTKIKGITYKPVVVHSQDFENRFNNTIKVNTGISHTVETSVATSWSKSTEIEFSQEVEYKLDVLFAKAKGVTGFSITSVFGHEVEKTETVTIGTTSSMETELRPGQACTAVLAANKGYLDVEVTYIAYLKGNVAVNYKREYNGHHFYGPSIAEVLESAGKVNEKTTTENIRVGFYSDASLKVYDKVSGEVL